MLQHFAKLIEPDPAPPERLAIAVFGQIRLAAEHLRPFLHGLVEREVVEGVERIVMDEDSDRPLRGQDV